MSKKPIAPLGFIPVDSEEAKGIGDDVLVNYAYVDSKTRWLYGNAIELRLVRMWGEDYPSLHYHIQLPPAVEWEEVWGWGEDDDGFWFIAKNGIPYELMGNTSWTQSQLNTIVAALNKMEVGNG